MHLLGDGVEFVHHRAHCGGELATGVIDVVLDVWRVECLDSLGVRDGFWFGGIGHRRAGSSLNFEVSSDMSFRYLYSLLDFPAERESHFAR